MEPKKEQTINPYDICNFKSKDECKACFLKESLICHFSAKKLSRFIGMFSLFLFPALIGVIRSGYGWYLLGWLSFMIIFFEFWEIRILCSHCPFYAENSLFLHCNANFGSLKVWKFRPEPMNRSEKIQLVIGLTILIGYPFPFLILGGQLVFSLLTAIGGLIFFATLQKYVCCRCVNFSCPLNRVSKNVINSFLEKNPTMKNA